MPPATKYELVSKIATGGMAELYVARGHEGLCVVKRLLPQLASEAGFVQMLLDEGRIASQLVHPNIVRTYASGIDDGAPYVAMELLQGKDLRRLVRASRARGELVPRAHVLGVILGVCAGLDHAHEARGSDGTPLGIVHRDVSPHNVFITFDGMVKIVDFGIAMSELRKTTTEEGTLKGKVPYMSPEQLNGARIDRRSDVYAVGVMLYELLLGSRPYEADNEFELMKMIAHGDVRPIRSIEPMFPPDLEVVIQRAMAWDPCRRYPTTRELGDDLERCARAHGLSVSGPPLAALMSRLYEPRPEACPPAKTSANELTVDDGTIPVTPTARTATPRRSATSLLGGMLIV